MGDLTPTLAEARDDLAAALAGTGFTIHPTVPEAIEPPCVVVQGGGPYLSEDDTSFDALDVNVNLELFLLASYASNDQAARDLDAMIAAVLPAVLGSGWGLSGSGSPGPYTTSEWIAYGLRVQLSRFVTLT